MNLFWRGTGGVLLGSLMLTPGLRPETDYWAARIALLALRMHSPTAGGKVRVLPSVVPVTEIAAARQLAKWTKPLRCEAHAAGGVLEVACTSLAESADSRNAEIALAGKSLEDWLTVLRQTYGPQSDNPSILVENGEDSVIVPLRAIRSFIQDYSVDCVLSLNETPEAQLPRGAEGVMSLRRGGPVKVRIIMDSEP